MRLLGYYAWHSFINQIRKLLKTWVLIFILICALAGGLIGFGAGMLADSLTEDSISSSVAYKEAEDGADPDGFSADEVSEEPVEDAESLTSDSGLGKLWTAVLALPTGQLVELIAGIVILVVFLYGILSADKNGSKIFLPADVNLLFPSPMKPQSVLMFRLMMQIGMILITTFYLALQLPNLMMTTGMSIWSGIGILVTWFLAILISKLLNILCYTVTATYPVAKRYFRYGIYALLLLLVGGCLVYTEVTGQDLTDGAIAFLNHPVSRWIPLWGWMKWFCAEVAVGSFGPALVLFAVTLVACGLLVFAIWQIKADFYEDAMAKSEHTAQVMEIQQAEQSVGFTRRKKDRSEKIRRDQMRHGSGANVFFFKSLYNRFRFAHLGFLTKTTETYLVLAVLVNLAAGSVLGIDSYLPAVLGIGIFVFYRTLGNPLAEDTGKDFFRMVPEPAFTKLLWSVLGGTVNCLLDILPAVIVTVLFHPEQALVIPFWIPVFLALDFYGTIVGAFINLSVPVSAGKIVKQMVQALFIYFGLLPAAGLLIYGILRESVLLSALLATLVCVLIGFVFLILTPRYLEYQEKTFHPERVFTEEEIRTGKKRFSTIGLAFSLLLIVSSVLQIGLSNLLPVSFQESEWGLWVITFVPIYVIGVPLCVLLLRRVSAEKQWISAPAGSKAAPERTAAPGEKLRIGQFVKYIFMSITAMYSGNVIGTLITYLIGFLKGSEQQAALMTYTSQESVFLKILFLVILAPIIEEFLFRKLLIDRIRVYGEEMAVLTSALMFGLFHGNFSQFFYAFFMGMLWGYVYLKTGKIRYSCGLHMGINFMGSVLGPWILEQAGTEIVDSSNLISGFILYMIYVIALITAALIGLVLYMLNRDKVNYEVTELELPKGKRFSVIWKNSGMLLFVFCCAALFLLSSL